MWCGRPLVLQPMTLLSRVLLRTPLLSCPPGLQRISSATSICAPHGREHPHGLRHRREHACRRERGCCVAATATACAMPRAELAGRRRRPHCLGANSLSTEERLQHTRRRPCARGVVTSAAVEQAAARAAEPETGVGIGTLRSKAQRDASKVPALQRSCKQVTANAAGVPPQVDAATTEVAEVLKVCAQQCHLPMVLVHFAH